MTEGRRGNELEIRPFDDADEGAVVALWQTAFADDPPRNEPLAVIRRKIRRQPDWLLVGTIDGAVAATVIVGYDGYRGWVYHLAVTPEHRRHGVGRRMMQAAEARLRAAGCPKLNLQVRSTNQEVVRFYERLGYSIEAHVSLGKEL